MANCCEDKACEITSLVNKHRKVLQVVLAINAVMFLVEGTYGWLANSTSLMADALDMLGDALVYGMSLYVLTQSKQQLAKVALAKSGFMLVFGLFVLADATYKVFNPAMPNIETMGIVGILALTANLVCFFLLFAHRDDNLNMSSTWLCSRNDLIANVGILFAALAGYLLTSKWPDILVGSLIALLFIRSAWSVSKQAFKEMIQPELVETSPIEAVGVQFMKKKDS